MKKLNPAIFILLSCLFFEFNTLSQTIEPQNDGSKYSLEVGNLYFEVDADFGGRVTSFQLDGTEFLSFNPNNANMSGSVLWPSPQSEWNWPPIPEIDEDAYSGNISGNKVILTSEKSSQLNLVIRKTYFANAEDTSITIIYSMINKGSSATNKAAWEVTRVPAGGISFFPTGEGSATGPHAEYLEYENDLSWYEHKSSHTGNQKFFSDGKEGWFAHVNESNVLFVKQFEEVNKTEQAPGEGEIELYLASGNAYIELENQSKYIEIQPDDSLVYEIKWYLRSLPNNIDISAGSSSLSDFVRGLLNIADTSNPLNIYSANINNIKIISDWNSNTLTILNLPETQSIFRIYSLTGVFVCNEEISQNKNSVFIKDLNKGLYIYSIIGPKKTFSGKILIR